MRLDLFLEIHLIDSTNNSGIIGELKDCVGTTPGHSVTGLQRVEQRTKRTNMGGTSVEGYGGGNVLTNSN